MQVYSCLAEQGTLHLGRDSGRIFDGDQAS